MSKPVELACSKTRKNDANNTWVTAIWFSNDHKVIYESRDRCESIHEAQKLAREYYKSINTFEAEGQAAEKYRKEYCKPKDISQLRPIVQDQIARQEKARFDAAVVTNIQIAPDEYQVDTCTMVTTKQANGHYKCVLTPLGHSAGYVGYSPSKVGSEVEAVKSYRKYNDTRNSQPKVEPNTLASDLREQEKVMAGLIEKAKRESLDGRLLAMANTDFERGFMALEKAIKTGRVDKYKVELVPC